MVVLLLVIVEANAGARSEKREQLPAATKANAIMQSTGRGDHAQTIT